MDICDSAIVCINVPIVVNANHDESVIVHSPIVAEKDSLLTPSQCQITEHSSPEVERSSNGHAVLVDSGTDTPSLLIPSDVPLPFKETLFWPREKPMKINRNIKDKIP
ncbi:uncharacterized protein LOC143368116 [Andrena cerasifolii]|uniref:uncharacterized protein LOC143368116 n=1 Tax=Andrena cerasifolii TaxID=2819439 RepID=UPI004037B2F4